MNIFHSKHIQAAFISNILWVQLQELELVFRRKETEMDGQTDVKVEIFGCNSVTALSCFKSTSCNMLACVQCLN